MGAFVGVAELIASIHWSWNFVFVSLLLLMLCLLKRLRGEKCVY